MGLVIPHFSFQRFNHTGGLAFHQGVKCLIFLLVSFFFLHNECKSRNVNKAFPHHTQALSHPLPAIPALTSAGLPEDGAPFLNKLPSCNPQRPSLLWLSHRRGRGRSGPGRERTVKPSPPPSHLQRLPSPPPQRSRRVKAALSHKLLPNAPPQTPISMHPGKGD